MPTATNHSTKQNIFAHATQTIGFDDCRFCDPHLEGELDETRRWLKQNFHGDMKYLEGHLKSKENPELLLPGVKSAIVLIKNYKNTPIRQLTGEFKIARYAVGKDYHIVMKEKLEELVDFMKKENPGMECHTGVDSRPLAERSLALKSGIGFLGKNTMVIKPGLGSYFFIGVILTNHSFERDAPLNWNCGSCRLCLEACPTGALKSSKSLSFPNAPRLTLSGTSLVGNPDEDMTRPPTETFGGDNSYFLDAAKCISYLTIEQKNPLTEEELTKTEGWLFGCDICQEVCPYNHGRTPLTDWKEFQPEAGVGFDFFKNLSFPNASIGNSNDVNGSPIPTILSGFRPSGTSVGTKTCLTGRQAFGGDSIPQDTPLYRSRKRVIVNFKTAHQIFSNNSSVRVIARSPASCPAVFKKRGGGATKQSIQEEIASPK